MARPPPRGRGHGRALLPPRRWPKGPERLPEAGFRRRNQRLPPRRIGRPAVAPVSPPAAQPPVTTPPPVSAPAPVPAPSAAGDTVTPGLGADRGAPRPLAARAGSGVDLPVPDGGPDVSAATERRVRSLPLRRRRRRRLGRRGSRRGVLLRSGSRR
ncbi:hypothetical protein OsJ_27702 [Oryza sativa Japonica Group]|uniref:Uncharacterized protein n=1 Tax=Oryza sativa subsp. japonica TaxID=39947 RepID=B9G1G5_ORYSJ|nr:hypothetical protein OsJ_27702 [Oryza sativa Japonica Group]